MAATSRGKLTNLSKDGHCIFVDLEQIVGCIFPASTTSVSEDDFLQKCIESHVVQDCFHNSTNSLDTTLKDIVLVDMISLYFKVRIH